MDAIQKIKLKRKKEGEEGVRKATKAINDFERKARHTLHRAGIDARKEERGRKRLLEEYYKRGDIPDVKGPHKRIAHVTARTNVNK
jgi:hypothetical protein